MGRVRHMRQEVADMLPTWPFSLSQETSAAKKYGDFCFLSPAGKNFYPKVATKPKKVPRTSWPSISNRGDIIKVTRFSDTAIKAFITRYSLTSQNQITIKVIERM